MNIADKYKQIVLEILSKKELDNSFDELVQIKDFGCPHERPKNLSDRKMVVYSFIHKNKFLKIGYVGEKSKARYTSQHYNPESSKSNLAKSVIEDKEIELDERNIGEWIEKNCQRVDIILDGKLGYVTGNILEAALQYHFEPKYEKNIVKYPRKLGV
ncbi:MAG: hypothetical protein LBC39_07975 [Methanobrevibacter sp.]|jgi:hypothetical protein|nr:hypothetical protein [Candidatus Methanovirga aequatorialis]